VGLVSLAVNAATAVLIHWPQPAVQDEFAYLLAADTFAQGRLTNPPPAMAEFFAAPHILMQPTYQAKYPPGQGLMLALGQVLCGEPIVGVWLSLSLACAAVCWMLQGWVPRRWALLGGLLAGLHYGLITSWGQSYWGGGIALAGGALVYGTLPRLLRNAKPKHGIVLAAGLVLLALSRPYEGLVAVLPAAALILLRCVAEYRAKAPRQLFRAALPFAVLMLSAAVWWSYYNWRVTGDPWLMPYQLHWKLQTGDASLAYVLVGGVNHGLDTASQVPWNERWFSLVNGTSVASKLLRQWAFWASPALIPALLTVAMTWRSRCTQLAAVTCLLVLTAAVCEGTRCHTHYTAPVGVLYFALVVQGLRWLRVWRWQGRPSGRLFAAGLPIVFIAATGLALATEWSERPYPSGHAWSLARASVCAELEAQPARDLVVVRYSPNHSVHHEWVFNRADLDRAAIVWAHWRGPSEMHRLIDRFSGRRVWLLDASSNPPRLAPYRAAVEPSPTRNLVLQ
jgi:hypothetical protein